MNKQAWKLNHAHSAKWSESESTLLPNTINVNVSIDSVLKVTCLHHGTSGIPSKFLVHGIHLGWTRTPDFHQAYFAGHQFSTENGGTPY